MNKKGEKIKKFKSFDDKIIDHHKKLLDYLHSKQKSKSKALLYSNYKTIWKSGDDIQQNIIESIDSALGFSQIIDKSFIAKSVRKKDSFYNHKLHKKISDFQLAGEKNFVKQRFVKEQRDFVMNVFSEKRINQILTEIFQFNRIIVPPKTYEKNKPGRGKKKFVHEEGDSISDEQREYYSSLATLLIEKGIKELKKYLHEDSQYDKPVILALDNIISTCHYISK